MALKYYIFLEKFMISVLDENKRIRRGTLIVTTKYTKDVIL